MTGSAITRIVGAVSAAFVAVALAACATSGAADSGAATSSPSTSSAAPSSSSGATSSASTIASSPVVSASSAPASSTAAPATTDPTEVSSTELSTPESPSTLAADGTDGWYDTWGWVSPQTAARALAAGIAAGKDVRDNLRCGTDCGEPPTAAQIQAQYILDHPDSPNASVEAYEAAAAACPGFFIRGNCYADADAAKAAGEGE